MISNQEGLLPLILEISIPILILCSILILAGKYLLRSEADSSKPITSNGGKALIQPTSHRLPMTYSNHHLNKWIQLAWENTWTNRIRLYYWHADRAMRVYLAKKGWF